MTKSYLINEKQQHKLSGLWVQNITAQRFSIRNITNQITHNLKIYLREEETFMHIIIFSFLGFTQLFFYTLGAFIVRLRLRAMSSPKNQN